MFAPIYIPNSSQSPPLILIASSIGTAVGQLTFGLLSDILGRKKVSLDAKRF